jgi:NADH-quinone oxidoreductase subunit N
VTETDLAAAGAAIVLALGGLAIALIALTRMVSDRALTWLGATVGIGAAVAAVANGPRTTVSGSSLALDGATAFFVVLIAGATALGLILSSAGARPARIRGDQVALLLYAAAGAATIVAAADLLVLFAGLALLSIPLSAIDARGDRHGAVRRALSSATALAVTAYGIALLYAATGETGYAALGRATHNPLYLAGLGLILAGLTWRAAIASRAWSILVTVGITGVLLRLIGTTRSGDVALDWEVSLAVLAALALAIGALAALTETSLRRLIGYATLGQLGYVLVASAGFAAPPAAFAITVTTTLSLGLFGVVALLPEDEPQLSDLAGLVRRRPLVALALGTFVLGLAGLPPTAGFLARAYVFEAAVRGQLLWLVVVGALATVVSAVAFARIVLACFAPPRLDAVAPQRARIGTAVLIALALAVMVVGVIPGPLLDAVQAVRF